MKRHNNLYERIIDSDNLIRAYHSASKSKKRRPAYQNFTLNLYDELEKLHSELSDDSYETMGYYEFMVKEPKERLIQAPRFRDVVVQHAVYNIIHDLFDRRFIYDSYACRIGKGTHRCSDRALEMVRKSDPNSYILKLDYKKFFYSINHDNLFREISKVIKCKRTLNLIRKFFGDNNVGIPIGSILSQLFANIYLNSVDQFVKRTLKVENYIRYMDDMVFVGISKTEAEKFRTTIEEFSKDNLHLEFSKTSITKVKKGLNFVGYRTWSWGRLIRKHALKNFNKFLRAFDIVRIQTMLAHAKNTKTLPYMIKQIQLTINSRRSNSIPIYVLSQDLLKRYAGFATISE